VKARLRILLTFAYVLTLLGHGLEHRLAAANPSTQSPDKDSCDTCAFLTFAGHAIGSDAKAPVPVVQATPDTAAPAVVVPAFLPVKFREGPLGARAPPRAA
jgi:hypothetical protein